MKLKTIFKLISIAILIIMLFPHSTVLAATVAEVGNAIGTFALNYYHKKGTSECPYVDWFKVDLSNASSYGKRAIPATGKPQEQENGKYNLDCVGWVNFCIYNATGIEESVVTSGTGGYVCPPGDSARPKMDIVSIGGSEVDKLQTGDIAITQTHVMVYVNNNGTHTFIHSAGTNGPVLNTWDDLSSRYKGNLLRYARVKQDVAADIDASELNTNPMLNGSGGSGKVQQSKFYYNGIPDGRYSVTSVNPLEWIIDALKNIFSFLINLITYIVRMVFVGWTFIVEELFTAIIKGLTGEDDIIQPDATDYGENGNKFTDDNITIDKIIFDEVKVFDINFFKSDTAEEATEEE